MDVPIRFLQGTAMDTHELRRTILGWNTEEIELDSERDTAHFIAQTRDGAVVGCGSVGRSVFPGETPYYSTLDAMRFWGVAVVSPLRGRGIGHQLMNHISDYALREKQLLIWANARESAVPFYVNRGFEIIGDRFTDSLSGLTDFRVGKLLSP